ncbi:gliding motility-associated ABC transporter permease subunit GldF [Rhodocytophaga rosea]|uniref:Gliding motility-associated ABC transporter permease subunit GldF n=1 Tax=Rhodocytophaga rosea TaxID=2704465 RepID=A0A6C0GMT7_9BACT|nr:gliding motility-associated ABC transporter permease subunit GldF [Rhodocytophaga rosea]QHT69247.1 gliding motility-associated ABC transporter permease subunit GldF [Rhodocytophaga rosea]
MLAILKKEIRSFLNSLIAYIIMIIFLTGMGLFVWVFPDTNLLDYGFADLSILFYLAPYVYMFLIPAITMRTFAEEKKAGTLELLLTRPLSDWDIILGKYLASLLLIIFTLIPTLVYYYSVYTLGNPAGNIDSAGVFGSYIGLVLLGAVFTAIGIFASSISDNQITSFIVAAFLCFVLYAGFSSLTSLDALGEMAYFINQLGIDYHYKALSKGLIDSRNLIYFFSLIAFMLMATRLVLGSRKW